MKKFKRSLKELSKKTMYLFMTFAMLANYILPITTVFAAEGSIKVNATSSGIISRIVISQNNDGSGASGDCITDQGDACSINLTNVLEKYYISVEPDFFTGGKITSVKINGDSKEITNPIGTNVYEVSFATLYAVEVEGEPSTPMGNIVWCTSEKACLDKDFKDPQGNADALVEHGKVEIVSIETANGVLTREELEEKRFDDGWYEFKDDIGYAEIVSGAKVTVKFIPDYGYQLTKMQINDTEFQAETEQSTFSFIMDDGPLHLSALFTKVDDVVKSSTNKVTSGTVKIGSNEINTGSVELSVKEATLTDAQKSTFATKAGDYKVSNVFDIKLDQVVYKGKADDVWTKPLGYSEDLQTPAVITLKLDEGVDGNTVVLIHEKEDGTYETIETTYDESTHTISFSTSSFSNYAIASKTTATTPEEPTKPTTPDNGEKNPQTGDNITTYFITLLLSIAGLTGASLIVNKRRKFARN